MAHGELEQTVSNKSILFHMVSMMLRQMGYPTIPVKHRLSGKEDPTAPLQAPEHLESFRGVTS